MENKIKEKIKLTEQEVIKIVSELVEIPSVRNLEDKGEGAPFGKDVRRALDYVIELAQSFGMRTFVHENGYYGYIEVGDESLKEMVGIVGHLDVVPGGDPTQWSTDDPFTAKLVDGTLYGRGSLDDKGPVVMALYSMKNLMDLGVKFNKRVRLILGTAEETTWECINEYVKNEEHPTISFSPDANFPVINAEKTIAQFDAQTEEKVDFEVEALGAYNAVPDSVTYKGSKVGQLKEELDKLGYEYKEQDGFLEVKGKNAHAMSPESGINSISHLCIALYNIGERSNVVDFIANKVKATYNAELIAGEVKDDISGKLKFNVARIKIKDGKGYIGMDARIPVLIETDKVMADFEQALKDYNLTFEVKKIQEKLYVEEDSFLVSTLLDVYQKVTGESNVKPISTGGGTYARAFKNCVAFGSVFSSQNQLDNMHQPDECLETKFIKPALEIYTNAIYRLSK